MYLCCYRLFETVGPLTVEARQNVAIVKCLAIGNPAPIIDWIDIELNVSFHRGSDLNLCGVDRIQRSDDVATSVNFTFRCIAKRDSHSIITDVAILPLPYKQLCGSIG